MRDRYCKMFCGAAAERIEATGSYIEGFLDG